MHETLLRDLYNILQCVFDPKPMNPKPILLILNQYIYSNPLFAETKPDLTKYISDLEIGLKVPTPYSKLIFRIVHLRYIMTDGSNFTMNHHWI